MQNQVWVTIIAALGGALIALTSSVVTTLLASRHAIKRQEIQLVHERELEIAKSLFATRLEQYEAASKIIEEVDSYFEWVLEESGHRTPIASLYPHERNSSVARRARALQERTILISSKPVMDSANDYFNAVMKVNGVLQKVRDSECSYLEDGLDLSELRKCATQLVQQIRTELGVAAKSGPLP